MADDRTDMPIEDVDKGTEEFDPTILPLGTFAAFDVSDEPMWTTKGDEEGKYLIEDEYKASITAMMNAVGRADSVARRHEVQGAWLLELLDRGFHRLIPKGGGWQIYGTSGPSASYGMYGANSASGYHDTNVIGEKNDIITACLVREIAESTFFPECPGDPDDEVYAQTANSLKYFIAEENKYGELQAQVARYFCTDESPIGYTRPVADAQRWGYEDDVPDVVPETEDGLDPDATEKAKSKRPKIRTITTIFGKLNRKVPIMARSKADWQYCMISEEQDVALPKSAYTWIADEIQPGDLGVAEMKLDRLARQSINLSMQSNYATGDSLQRDCTVTRLWFRPGFYMDSSCPKERRAWFWNNFPKGMLVVYAGGKLAFCRNESMDEVLTEFHARSGNGQNRRALTESYAGPQQRLNVLVDLRDEFCRKSVPRVGLDADVWDVQAIRTSSVRVGAYEPFRGVVGRQSADSIVSFPVATGTPDLTAFIEWLAGPLAEQLTHAQPALAASEGDDPETFGQSKLQNNNAMASFGESWKNILQGFANMTTQAVAWNARVQPDDAKFDSTFPGQGRLTAEISSLKMGSGVARADGTANFPESWADRQLAWERALNDQNPMMQQIISDPRNLAAMQEFAPKGMYLPKVAAVKKQQGEFDVLLKSAPVDNPQYVKLQAMVQQGQQMMQMAQQSGEEVPPEAQQMLEQAQQALQQMQPLISSVPLKESDDDATEAMICDEMLNSEVGRRLGNSQDPKDQQHYQNLNLHWKQHQAAAEKKAAAAAAAAQQPIPPRTSISVDASKLEGAEQDSALQKLGIAPNPPGQEQQMQPHEMTTKEKGIGPSGSEIERTVSVAGKKL